MRWSPDIRRRLRELVTKKKRHEPQRPESFTPKKRRTPPQEKTT